MKGEGCAHRSLESGGTACHSGPHREAPGWGAGGGRRGRRKMWARAFIVFSMGKVGRGRVIKLRAGQFQ